MLDGESPLRNTGGPRKRFKLDRLVPAMSEALGVRSFNLVTRSGFGCYSCHLGPDGPQFGN